LFNLPLPNPQWNSSVFLGRGDSIYSLLTLSAKKTSEQSRLESESKCGKVIAEPKGMIRIKIRKGC